MILALIKTCREGRSGPWGLAREQLAIDKRGEAIAAIAAEEREISVVEDNLND